MSANCDCTTSIGRAITVSALARMVYIVVPLLSSVVEPAGVASTNPARDKGRDHPAQERTDNAEQHARTTERRVREQTADDAAQRDADPHQPAPRGQLALHCVRAHLLQHALAGQQLFRRLQPLVLGHGPPHRALTARFWPQWRAGATGAGP